ncbi:MAG: hypothetical protein JWL71_2848 [Acidobacteria bacterium]|nr:hypothetical protein [Acidobacteriota bacterium]
MRSPAPRARAAPDCAVVDLRQYKNQRRAVRSARTRRCVAVAVRHLSPKLHPRVCQRHRPRPRHDRARIRRAVPRSARRTRSRRAGRCAAGRDRHPGRRRAAPREGHYSPALQQRRQSAEGGQGIQDGQTNAVADGDPNRHRDGDAHRHRDPDRNRDRGHDRSRYRSFDPDRSAGPASRRSPGRWRPCPRGRHRPPLCSGPPDRGHATTRHRRRVRRRGRGRHRAVRIHRLRYVLAAARGCHARVLPRRDPAARQYAWCLPACGRSACADGTVQSVTR